MARTAHSPSRGVLRALVIDDSVEDVMRVRDLLLSTGGFHVHGVRHVVEARELLDRGACDVALIDYRLWGGEGSELVSFIRDRSLDVAVVLLTSEGDDRDAVRTLKLGVQDFLRKERLGDGEYLAARIHAAVEEMRSLRRRDTLVRWLEREARTDHLTGLHNRRAFDERLRAAWEAACTAREPISLVLADVQQMRQVNELYGHAAGDELLRRAASAIARSLRAGDFAARIGGDDFGIILAGADLELARRIARRIAHEVERLNTNDDGQPQVGLAFGLATSPAADASELFAAADRQVARRKSRRAPIMVARPQRANDGPLIA